METKTVPVVVTEDHNEVLPHIYRAIGAKRLPFSNLTMIHFDSHPDLLIPVDMNADDTFNKNILFDTLSIENWIIPAVFAGHISHVVWVKPPWCRQIEDKQIEFYVGRCPDTGSIRLSSKESYFVSETLYVNAEKLLDRKLFRLSVVTLRPRRWESLSLNTCSNAGMQEPENETLPVSSSTCSSHCVDTTSAGTSVSKDRNNEHRIDDSERNISLSKMSDPGISCKKQKLSGFKNTGGSQKIHSENECKRIQSDRQSKRQHSDSESKGIHSESEPKGKHSDTESKGKHSESECKRIHSRGESKGVHSESESEIKETDDVRISSLHTGIDQSGSKSEKRKTQTANKYEIDVGVKESSNPCELSKECSEHLQDVLDTLSKSVTDSGFILDIDLDFFSTLNPFRMMLTPFQYNMLRKLYLFTAPSSTDDQAIAECLQKRKEQLSQLKLALVNAKPELAGDNIKVLMEDLLTDLQKTGEESGRAIDLELIHEAGCTCDDTELPHHQSSDEQIQHLMVCVEHMLSHLPNPNMITVARSSQDDYCPPEQVDFIEELLLETLHNVYDNLIVKKDYQEPGNELSGEGPSHAAGV